MPRARSRPRLTRRSVVVSAGALVYAALAGRGLIGPAFGKGARKTGGDGKPPASSLQAGVLPQQVVDMLDLIRAAVRSGDIGELRAALEWNELPLVVADDKVADPIAFWRQASADGEGREILAVLSLLLDGEPALLPLGHDIENNRTYVWPSFVDRPLATLTGPEKVQLLRLVPFAEMQRMMKAGRYDAWRLVIGVDGTWHSFRRG